MSQYRTPTAYVLGVLVLLVVIVLTTPNGGTQARWSATGQAAVPAMTMGRVGFEVAGAESSATLTSTSGFGVEYRPVRVALVDADGESVPVPAGTGFAYRTGADCGHGETPAQWTAVAPGGPGPVAVGGASRAPLERDRPAGLCLTISTGAVTEDELRALAGRARQVVTQLEAASLGDGTWSTTRSWTAPFAVDLPAGELPAEELPPVDAPVVEEPVVEEPPVDAPVVEEPPVDAPTVDPPATTPPARPETEQCTTDRQGALLRWTWTGGSDTPAVTAWEIWMRPLGTTGAPTRVKTVPDGAARAARVTAAELLAPSHHRASRDYETYVRAVFAAGPTSHADSAYAWQLKTPGGSDKMNCAGLPS